MVRLVCPKIQDSGRENERLMRGKPQFIHRKQQLVAGRQRADFRVVNKNGGNNAL